MQPVGGLSPRCKGEASVLCVMAGAFMATVLLCPLLMHCYSSLLACISCCWSP